MEPSIRNGSIIIKNYLDKNYKKGDIIIFYKNNMDYIKRIYAENNDLIEITGDKLFINGKFICNTPTQANCSYILSENEFFVIGDNFANSIDSRHFGLIKLNEIEVKVYEK